MQLIDTHSHIDVHHFSSDRQEVLQRSRACGVAAQVLPGVCRNWWPNLLSLCASERDLFAAVGLHPMYLSMHTPAHLSELRVHAESGCLVALGEIGLDHFIKDCDPQEQLKLFEAQLEIAQDCHLPVLLHVRKAHDQVQSVIRRKNFDNGGIVHAYSGSLQQAEKYIQLGFFISFGGTITYPRAKKIRNIAEKLPLASIVLETDAPDIPPLRHHGERNSPEYLPQILDALASLRGEGPEKIARKTTENAVEILKLPHLLPQQE